ncbi:hypothetical protein N864_22880 [Intrasporangium chromatireducens Q5-1]|uniref:DUF1697 domain-containing protein n=1 Tax=Intrasporangium chromatireducens Q5-1 TaxID=584657 RepID=W9GJH5_9MICO|nr:DUF1697 domain-containing protein [Intrasporangium chromatireducens]EWT06250.1 hypothetical protein N864_22880 [Intrasporangium chromatireducens Q5-1]
MPSHVALLRGINVGGRGKLPMAQLRAVLESLGHRDVATYIQSGNAVFTATGRPRTTALAREIEDAIESAAGFRPPTVVLTGAELAAVSADNPFPHVTEAKQLHAGFFPGPLGRSYAAQARDAQQLAHDQGSRDEVAIDGSVVYLHTPDGLGRSRLAELLGRIKGDDGGKVLGTFRNWATVGKLLDLLDEPPG